MTAQASVALVDRASGLSLVACTLSCGEHCLCGHQDNCSLWAEALSALSVPSGGRPSSSCSRPTVKRIVKVCIDVE